MLFTQTAIYCVVALASLASAVPTFDTRDSAVEVFTNGNSTILTPLVSASVVTASLSAAKSKPKRQVTFAADQIVITIIDKVTALIQGMIDSDINRRKSFTQQVVGSAMIQFPGKNVVMSNVGYTFTGSAITIQRAVYDAKIGANVDYDVLVFNNGNTFTLQGDGGFQNWCYNINPSCVVSGGGAILKC